MDPFRAAADRVPVGRRQQIVDSDAARPGRARRIRRGRIREHEQRPRVAGGGEQTRGPYRRVDVGVVTNRAGQRHRDEGADECELPASEIAANAGGIGAEEAPVAELRTRIAGRGDLVEDLRG